MDTVLKAATRASGPLLRAFRRPRLLPRLLVSVYDNLRVNFQYSQERRETGGPMSEIQRRDFLTGAASVAAATTAMLAGAGKAGAGPPGTDDRPPEPIRGNQGATPLGPRNRAREAQGPDRLS